MTKHELLSVDEMGRADQGAVAAGVSGLNLMERAGRAVADTAARLAGRHPIVVLCGPGNNGGDGYVAARYLRNRGHAVTVMALGDPSKLSGDAATNFERWRGETRALSNDVLTAGTVIVDAMFGAGLTRNISGPALEVVRTAKDLGLVSVAVDLPSGVSGDTGTVLGDAIPAVETVTFFRKKPGHLLYPGRQLCGIVTVVDIGIPASVLNDIAPTVWENTPALWRHVTPLIPDTAAHKYTRGHLVVAGGAAMTGAARLAARGARRCGAGLVTLAVPPSSRAVYAAGEPGTIVEAHENFAEALTDARRNACVVGPGLGISAATRTAVISALHGGVRAVVLDADGLSSFADDPAALFGAISGPVVMTPHDGEFKRLFGDIEGDKLGRARIAAQRSGAVIVLKGADTVIAAPDGRAAINASAPPWLATAGAGDVLAGMVGAMLAGGTSAFEAACAAVWLHGRAATIFGPGLIAEDLPEMLPKLLAAQGSL